MSSPSIQSSTTPTRRPPSSPESGRLRIAFVVSMAAVLFSAALGSAVDLFVAIDGDDTHSGASPDAAFATIQHASDAARPGDTVYILGGTYRQEVLVTNYGAAGMPISFRPYEGAEVVIKGSDIVSGWTVYADSIWCRTNWPVEPQQLFDDGAFLRQIGPLFFIPPPLYKPLGSNVDDLVRGSFFYDTNSATLYAWLADDSDPNESVMEAGSRVRCFYADGSNQFSYLHVDGLTFRHANTCTVTSGWPAVGVGGNSLIENCDVQWCDFQGLELGHDSTAVACNVSNNGNTGMRTYSNFFIRGCTIWSNNYRKFNKAWHAGGIKIIPDFSGTIEECDIGWNAGPGVWFDYCRTGLPLIVRNNYIHHNTGDGVMIEVSTAAEIYNNLLVANSPRSVYLSSAWNNRVYNNTIVDNRNWMTIDMDYVATRTNSLGQPFPVCSNYVFNNVIYGGDFADLAMWEEDGSNVYDNVSDYNCYWPTSGQLRLHFRWHNAPNRDYNTLSNWTAATGMDRRSVLVNPRFRAPWTGNYHLAPGSPCVDRGTNLPWMDLSRDFDGDRRPRGRPVDLGFDERSIQVEVLFNATNGVSFEVGDGASGTVYRLDRCLDLFAADWRPAALLTSRSEIVSLSDPTSSFPRCFYRVVEGGL